MHIFLVGSVSPNQPSTSDERSCRSPEGAVGGAVPDKAGEFPETTSIMNELPPQIFGKSPTSSTFCNT